MDSLSNGAERAVAIVGLGAILPDALNPTAFWQNIVNKRYSIIETPPDRWCIEDYYDPDPNAPDKTYSKIGGWVKGFEFDWKQYRIPPRVAAAMDQGQQWAVTIAGQALADYGYPQRPLDTDRTAVILGVAMGGEQHYLTTLRASFPEYVRALEAVPEFRDLPLPARQALVEHWREVVGRTLPPITEDSMPGELANIVSGRVANVFNLRGPNYTTDAACASSCAAVDAAVELLTRHRVDAVLTGGVDRNMGASTFIKFCKIGALSATGTRPFGLGADGFVMGEGSAVFLLKRLEDAERAGDRIYAVVRGVGGSSDGKGKGITAPNPIGQRLAIQRAWENAALDPATATLIEAHGTSTKVGDVVEVESLASVFAGGRRNSIALGSVKSNFGHLKAGAGAAGLLKATLAIHHRLIPPTLHAENPNPDIDFGSTPFYLANDAQEWKPTNGDPRRAAVSAYGFGGTNFHIVLEEHIPGALTTRRMYAVTRSETTVQEPAGVSTPPPAVHPKAEIPHPPRGILAIGGGKPGELGDKLAEIIARAEAGWMPPIPRPSPTALAANERIVIDYGDHDELLDRLLKAQKALALDVAPAWRALQAQGIFRGSGAAPGKIAFLFPGQGSQYLNMGRELARLYPVVAATFADGDRVMTPILGKPLTAFMFPDTQDPAELKQMERRLTDTDVCQPAMLTLDTAIFRLLGEFGFKPDMVMGHSLGEYAALIAAGIMPFDDALEAAAARGQEMSSLKLDDTGWMAAVMAPYPVIEQTLKEIDGYVVAANINSRNQSVVGGESKAVERAIELFNQKGLEARRLPVSHAFHTRIVAPASKPLREVLNRLHIAPPQLPLVGNVKGEFYPNDVEGIKDLLERQIASPVQWVKGLETLYGAGARTFVEVGPKKALKGLVDDVLGNQADVVSLFTNHPKTGELPSLNQALCGLYAAGYGKDESQPTEKEKQETIRLSTRTTKSEVSEMGEVKQALVGAPVNPVQAVPGNGSGAAAMAELGHVVAQVLQQMAGASAQKPFDRNEPPAGSIVITGTGLGLPGAEKHVMDPDNVMRILHGEQFVDLIPERFRKRIVAKRVTRVVKSEDGSGRFETITDEDEVVRLAGRGGYFDLSEEYGVPAKLIEAFDITTQLAMAAGLDAMREAGIPLVQTYKQATTGKILPDRWMLPESLRDETGVIFASAFPGGDRFADEIMRYYVWENRHNQYTTLEELRNCTNEPQMLAEIVRRMTALREEMEREPYEFDRRFLFRLLSMGHSQFAEYIGARGPNTQVNAACASTTQAIGLAEDWIRFGRARRVIVIAADDVTSDHLMEWVGAGFLASGAAATDSRVEEAALPFDRRRHGTLMGMGACALVVESEDAARERGVRGIVELLSSVTSNSAFHGTRLDVDHIALVMNDLVTAAERRFGVNRYFIAPEMVFMSHETFTPARGGSAAAEVVALRKVFGETASHIVVANTKGFTGHPMGVGVEDVIAAKILEYGIVPPVPNFKEVDPELGPLNLSRGGRYPVKYALHLSAGFGSQIAMTLTRRIPGGTERIENKLLYDRWLADVSGYDRAETLVVKRVLRVKADTMPTRAPVPSLWRPGTGPIVRVSMMDGQPTTVPAALPWPPVPQYKPQIVQQHPIIEERRVSPAETRLAPAEPAPSNGKARHADLGTAPAPSAPATAAPTLQAPTPAPVVEKPAPTPAPAPASAVDRVAEQVLEIVAEKTGYPKDMLALDLDLEADLGIDTVKQAETFAAIREAFDIPRRENLKLRDYPTLARVIGFVKESKPELAQAAAPSAPPVIETAPATTSALQEQVAQVAPAAPTRTAATDEVVERVLQIVADKTGYPREMLDLDLDLEADLGIDTVKQAETFAAIREAFDIPRRENLKLRDYPTLARVIGFVKESKPELAAAMPPLVEAGASPTPAAPKAAAPRPVAGSIEEANKMPRRIPVPVLRPALELCKPTGVTLSDASRVVVMLDEGGVGAELVKQLQARGVTALVIAPPVTAEAVDAQIKAWLSEGPIQGVYWLPAVDVEPNIEQLTVETWHDLLSRRVKNLYTTMRALYEAISVEGTFLLTATRLGGLHGYGPDGATAPLGGAVTGFAKAFKRERPQALVKTVDFGDDADIATLLIEETLADPGVVEVGYWNGTRFGIGLEERPVTDAQTGLTLGPNSVFVVTGAAGGITSAIVGDLAAASGGTFYLLDLVPEPEPNDPHIALFRQDKEALKQRLIQEAKTEGERPTPAKIDKQILAVERLEAALRAVESVEAAGGHAFYRSVNLLDGAAVTAVVDEIRAQHGRIDVIVHAGGIEISRNLPDKDPKQFDLVFDIKADGFFHLLHAAQGMPLGATVVFSSVAGRFGNSGQTDYSAANDLLCKITSSLRRWRPETRGIAIDWTAWGGIGMATRGSIPKIMEMAGIETLPPSAGIPTVRRELCEAGDFRGEVLVAGRLGILGKELDEQGGLDPAKTAEWLSQREPAPLMTGQVKAYRLYGGLEVETTLDPKLQPFLYDHQMGGTPLLPGVMGIETFAELATLFAPGYHVVAVEKVEYQRPFKFHRMQCQTLHLHAVIQPSLNGELLAQTMLKSVTILPRNEMPPQEKVHFTAQVRLARGPAETPALAPAPSFEGTHELVDRDTIYHLYFHGPAYQVLERVGVDGVQAIGLMAEGLPPNSNPPNALSVMAPRLIEFCYQTAGIWEIRHKGVMALPMALKSVRVYRQPEEAEGRRLFAVVEAVQDGAEFNAQVVDENGNVYVTLEGYRTVALMGG